MSGHVSHAEALVLGTVPDGHVEHSVPTRFTTPHRRIISGQCSARSVLGSYGVHSFKVRTAGARLINQSS